MLISSKGQYALRLMVDISINSGSTVTVKAVARRCGLSDKYLEQVTSSLLKAGYLRSVRGPRGGYRLTGSIVAEKNTVASPLSKQFLMLTAGLTQYSLTTNLPSSLISSYTT